MTKHEYQSLPRPLADSLRRLDLRVRGLAVLRGVGLCCAIAGAALAVGLGIDWLIDVGVTARTVLLIGVIATVVITLAAVILRPLLRRTSASELAALVDAAYPALGERIESAVELSDARLPERHRGSPVMRSLLLDQTVRQTETVDFGAAAEPRSALRWMATGTLTLLLLLAPFGLSRDGYGLLIRRFLAPWENLERATNLYFHIENGDRAVARGMDVTIVAEPRWRVATTALPDHAWLHWQAGDGKTDARRMEFDTESGTFRATIPHALTSFDYDVSAGRVRTRTYQIDVVEAPSLERLLVEIEPPAYTGRPARRLDGPSGRIDVFERSRMTFRAAFGQPVESAALIRQSEVSEEATDGEEPQPHAAHHFQLADDSRSGTFTLMAESDGEFSIEFRNLQGVRNLRREPWELVIIADERPAIEWADGDRALDMAGASVEVRPGEQLPLPVIAADDIGVAELELHAEIVQRGKKLEPRIAESPAFGQPRVEHTFTWDLSSLSLQEGDLLSLRARAVDGRPVPGPQEAWTESRLVRITTEAESVEESLLAQRQQQLRDVLKAIQKNVQQDRSDTESLRKAAREASNKQQPLDQQEPISNLAERQQKLTAQLNQLAAVFDEHPLQRNMAEATRNVGTGPLDAAREQFQQAATSQSQQQLEQLTNAADLLDRADDQLERLLKRYDELAALERDLQRLQQLADDAEQLSSDVADFEQDWQELNESNEPNDELRQSRTNELAEQHDQLESNQQDLSGALDRLLEERPEVLQAATERQLERLKELEEQASRLADREQRLADALEKESASDSAEGASQPSDDAPEADEPSSASEAEISADEPPPPSVATKASDSPMSDESPTSNARPMTEQSATPAEPAPDAEESEVQDPKLTALPSDEVGQDSSEPPPGESSVAERQQQLANEAARMALETARSRGVENPAAQQAKTFAEQALQAAEDAQTGLLNDAADKAEKAAESANETAKQMHNPTDPSPESLKQKAEELAQQQSELAEELRDQAESPAARQQAQAEGQKQLSKQTAVLSEKLQEITERLGSEPLEQKEESEQAGAAQQAADEAQGAMKSAQQALQQGQSDKAVPHARSAAESLRKAAQQAGKNQSPPPGKGPGNNPSDQSSPVPGEVGEQVAEARRQLHQAGQQLGKNSPSKQPTETPSDEPGQPQSTQQANAKPTETEPSDAPSDAEAKPDDMPPSNDAPPMEESEQPSDQPGDQTQDMPMDAPQENASESMKRVAESLRQAARQLGMAPTGSDKNGKPGEQEGDPSEGKPGSQSGNSGKNPISLVELEAELQKMSSRDWGQLPGQIESDLLQSTQKKPDADYARLIRLYFEEISRRRSAEENLVPNDNDE